MQLRGCELGRVSRIVIIVLLVQHLGLGPALVAASARGAEADPAHPSPTLVPPGAVLSTGVITGPVPGSISTLEEHGSPTIPPDPAPLPRRLPRAPPAD